MSNSFYTGVHTGLYEAGIPTNLLTYDNSTVTLEQRWRYYQQRSNTVAWATAPTVSNWVTGYPWSYSQSGAQIAQQQAWWDAATDKISAYKARSERHYADVERRQNTEALLYAVRYAAEAPTRNTNQLLYAVVRAFDRDEVKRREARERKLLQDVCTPEQWAEFQQMQTVTVVAPSQTKYVIMYQSSVVEMPKSMNDYRRSWCLVPYPGQYIGYIDQMVAKILWLRYAEPTFRSIAIRS